MGLKPPTSLYRLAGKTKDSPPFFSNGQVWLSSGRQIFSTFGGGVVFSREGDDWWWEGEGVFWGLHFFTHTKYCWWTKSCTTKDDDYPIIWRVLYIPGGAGFLPSTVCRVFFWKWILYVTIGGGNWAREFARVFPPTWRVPPRMATSK